MANANSGTGSIRVEWRDALDAVLAKADALALFRQPRDDTIIHLPRDEKAYLLQILEQFAQHGPSTVEAAEFQAVIQHSVGSASAAGRIDQDPQYLERAMLAKNLRQKIEFVRARHPASR